jgi:hypothetical protein
MILVEVMAVYGRLNDAPNALAFARARTQQDSRIQAELPGSNVSVVLIPPSSGALTISECDDL